MWFVQELSTFILWFAAWHILDAVWSAAVGTRTRSGAPSTEGTERPYVLPGVPSRDR
jgi:hypothetical protein